jgi:hypothetical protein
MPGASSTIASFLLKLFIMVRIKNKCPVITDSEKINLLPDKM